MPSRGADTLPPGRHVGAILALQNTMRVVSVSRRTDIPAFYTPWFLRRMAEGYCDVVNPRSGVAARVSLEPSDVLAFGLFTRQPRALVPHLPELMDRGHRFYAHMTITGYPDRLEPRSPALPDAVASFRVLSREIGSDFTLWRYDPIVLTPELDERYHLERFSSIAGQLDGYCKECVISFVDPYAKTRRNVAESVEWTVGEPHVELAGKLVEVASRHGLRVRACAEEGLLRAGVGQAACVDPELIARLRPDRPVRLRLASTREGCLCHQAVDIGAYHTCAFGCAYCYATETPAAGLANRLLHDPEDTLLLRPPSLQGVDLSQPAMRPLHDAEGAHPTLF